MINKLIYNWLTFDTTWVLRIVDSNDDNIANIEVNTFKLPTRNGERIIDSLYRKKIINISWYITWWSKYDLNNQIITIKKKLTNELQNIELYYQTLETVVEKRVGEAIVINPDSFINRESYGVNFCKFNLKFMIPAWYLEDEFYTTIAWPWATSNISLSPTYSWTINTNPYLELTINTVADIDKIQFEIWDKIIWTYNNLLDDVLADWDVIEFDWINQNVYQNWNQIDFFGFFPTLYINDNVDITFLDSGGGDASSYSVDYSFKFKNNYK